MEIRTQKLGTFVNFCARENTFTGYILSYRGRICFYFTNFSTESQMLFM